MTRADDIERSRSRIRAIIAMVAEIERKANEALIAIESALQGSVNDLATTSSSVAMPACEHRRAHRPGRPGKINSDAELRAFVLARIDRMTFVKLAEEIAEHFPPHRRVGKSALHEWFHKNRPESHPQ